MVIGCEESRRFAGITSTNKDSIRVPIDNSGMPLSLLGITVLVVEDEFLIALDTSQTMTDAGADKVLTARSCSEAVSLLDTGRCDVAILDVHLHSETSFELADLLADRSIPFVFATGYYDKAIIPERHGAAQVIQKPFRDGELVRTIEAIVCGPLISDIVG